VSSQSISRRIARAVERGFFSVRDENIHAEVHGLAAIFKINKNYSLCLIIMSFTVVSYSQSSHFIESNRIARAVVKRGFLPTHTDDDFRSMHKGDGRGGEECEQEPDCESDRESNRLNNNNNNNNNR
jgi:hypothetical protein